MKRITAVQVTYEDGSSASFDGAGTMDEFQTEQHTESDGKKPIRYVSVSLQLSAEYIAARSDIQASKENK